MTYLSLMEKIKILLSSLSELKFVSIFIAFLTIITLLYMIKKISVKKYTISMLISFIIIFGISIIKNYKILSSTFDNFTTIFFGNIYFPSIYVYISILVISFISFMVSILNKMLKNVYKIINTIMFVVNNILFVIIINIIAINKIDIFSVNSLYTNTSIVALLELSMGLCILWLLSLIVAYTTDVISERLSSRKVRNLEIQEETFSPVLEVTNELIGDINALPNSILEHNDTLIEMTSNGTEENISPIVFNEIIDETISDIIEEEKIENNIDETLVIIEEETNNVKENIISEVTISEIESEVSSIEKEESPALSFNDILNSCIEVTYYDTSAEENEYMLFNPQEIYESNYNKIKNESMKEQPLFIALNNSIEAPQTEMEYEEVLSMPDTKLLIEEQTLIEKEKNREERLGLNTISLNDLIDEEQLEVKESINLSEVENKIEDYKKMLEMLNAIKPTTGASNINIDDAIALSLINNYSIDDCLKFKKLLESNLNY